MSSAKIALIVLSSIQLIYNIGAMLYLIISSRRKK